MDRRPLARPRDSLRGELIIRCDGGGSRRKRSDERRSEITVFSRILPVFLLIRKCFSVPVARGYGNFESLVTKTNRFLHYYPTTSIYVRPIPEQFDGSANEHSVESKPPRVARNRENRRGFPGPVVEFHAPLGLGKTPAHTTQRE